MKILGLTGGIATGKSTVRRVFETLGAPSIDADEIARSLLAPGKAEYAAVTNAFSICIGPSGLLDRRALADLVFSDSSARTRLEAILHPPIRAIWTSQVSNWRMDDSASAAIAEIPLLYETGSESLVDAVVVVFCAETVQVERVKRKFGVDAVEAMRRINVQWPLAEKAARADFVIDTNGSPDQVRAQVLSVWHAISAAEVY